MRTMPHIVAQARAERTFHEDIVNVPVHEGPEAGFPGGVPFGYRGSSSAGAMRLLVIEDDRSLLTALGDVLAAIGFAIDRSPSLECATVLLSSNPYVHDLP